MGLKDWGGQEKEAEAGNAKYGRLGHPWTPPPFPKGVETELMGLRKSRKRGGIRECKVREVGTSLKPPSPPKGVETEIMRLRKSRKRGGSRECKVREVGTFLTHTPPKNVLNVLQRFFCPVGDERSLIVILLSVTWVSIKLESFKDQVLVGCTN